MKEFDFLVFIGRFQPFHNGHKRVIDRALELANRVIILVGSAHEAPRFHNPWNYDDRKQMILDSYPDEIIGVHGIPLLHERLLVFPLDDVLYTDIAWEESVQKAVDHATVFATEILYPKETLSKPYKIGLIGHSKDESSYYLNKFPQWDSVDVPGYDDKRLLDATWVRELYFSQEENSQTMDLVLPAVVPEGTLGFLKDYHGTERYQWIVEEHVYSTNYKKPYAGLKHEVMFTTVDAVVVQSGHVLLIERRSRPGKGLLAIPGGFMKPFETIKEAMLRELREETRLKVAERTLRGSIHGFEVFDHPWRSERGRVITNAFLINLEPQHTLPKVRGGSDAKRADWYPISELDRTKFFEDHYHIIRKMTAGV